MLRFLRIERPTMATFTSTWIATSIACCIRWAFEANRAARISPCAAGISVRNASPTSRSEPVGIPAARRSSSREHQVDAEVSELREPADVRLEPVDGRVVELPVARVDDPAGGGFEDDRDAVRSRVRHADEVQRERADRICFPVSASSSCVDW